MEGTASDPAPRGPWRRPTGATFPARRRHKRHLAQRRMLSRTHTSLTPTQRAVDPLVHGDRTTARRFGKAALALLGSTGVHVGIVVLGIVIGGLEIRRNAESGEVVIQVQERKREPPPPPPPAPPPPVVEKRPERPTRVVAAPPPPSEPTPSAAPKAAPVRVVGLSLDSTTAGGGDGPAFAVGNTRMGQTAERAVAPKALTPPPRTPEAPAAKTNQAATRIPVLGVKRTASKRRKPSKPPYPETLKSQGVEADVTVMVSIGADGKVADVKIIRPSPYPEFNDAATAAAHAEEYEPATKDGVPIPETITFTYRWRLEEQQ